MKFFPGLFAVLMSLAGYVSAQNQVLSVTPNSGDPGTSSLTLTFVLDSDTPAPPPAIVSVDSVTVGSLPASNFLHTSQYEVTVEIDIPADTAGGTHDVSATFTTPQGELVFSKSAAFTVTGDTGTQSHEGYNLFTPMSSTNTYLMDNNGTFVHSWASSYRPGLSVYLLENGTLMRTANTGDSTFNAGGAGGRVEQFSWDGDLLWEFEYSDSQHRSHHDIAVLPNSNVLVVAWELKTEAEAIVAGRNPTSIPEGELWVNHIIEVEPSGTNGGTIVWEWHAWDHLVQDYDAGKTNYGVVADHPELVDLNFTGTPSADWLQVNSIDYNAELDQIILSVHGFSEIWIIDHSTTTGQAAGHSGGDSGKGGDLLYRWGNPQTYGAGTSGDQQLFVQHDAEWIADGLPGAGNILIFNNGQGRPGGNYSSIDEIVPPLAPDGSYSNSSAFGPSAPTWTYTASTPTNFYATNISGSQRLPNGHTLICDGPAGEFFEVTTNGESIWSYSHGSGVFRVERYGFDYPGLAALAPDPPEAPSLSYAVVDTAQNTCYNNNSTITPPDPGDAFAGQDAQYSGYAPQYTISSDGLTVYDHNTSLTWQQTPDTDGNGVIDSSDKKTWAEAPAYAATLNAATYGGYDDWRVPSIKELYSLMDFRGTDPMGDDISLLTPFIDTNYFDFGYGDTNASERTIDAQFVTDTLYVTTVMNGQAAMFGLNLADGRIKGYPTTKGFYVLCVRGNTNYGVNAFTANSDGTVTDHATGLIWQQADSGTGMLWEDALSYSEGLDFAGYQDWRLPNAKELHSILDYTRSPGTTGSGAIDPVFYCTQITNEFPAEDYPWYWSSTTHKRNGNGFSGVYICFGRGTGYMNGEWMDVHGAGCQRADRKDGDFSGYTYVYDGYYNGSAPQGDASRMYNHVRCVRAGATAPDTDTDDDGLTDWYEWNYVTNITAMVPTEDDDNDGASNGDEADAGTIPTDPDSVFAITDLRSTTSTVVITWSSEIGQTYALWGSSNLLSDAWWFIEAGIPATPPDNVHTVTPDNANGEFYLIEVE